MTTVRFESGAGLLLPTSGELVGLAAEFLRLKGFVSEAGTISPKTAERYYRGERVAAESVRAVLEALVAEFHPELLLDTSALELSFGIPSFTEALLELSERWDRLASTLNSDYFPVITVQDAALPFLRMVTLDFGIRWAAYQALRAAQGHSPILVPPWLVRDAFRVVMDEYRKKAPPRSLTKLAAELRVSGNSMDAWRAGTSLPTEMNLDELAAVFAADTNEPRERVKAHLRSAVGLSAAWHKLASFVSDPTHIANLVLGFETVAQASFAFLKWLPLPLDERGRLDALRTVVELGARADAGSQVGFATCRHLATECAYNQRMQADLLALPGDWTERVNEWIKLIGSKDAAARHLAEQCHLGLDQANEILTESIKAMMKMDGLKGPEKYRYSYVLKGDDAFKAMNRVAQAELAWSFGDRATALDHMQRAVDLQPNNASYRRGMGAWLGELVTAGFVEFLNISLAHLGDAASLDPTDVVAATEIGIVLSNAGLLQEAEEAFARAESLSSSWHHFHKVRGINFAYLASFEDAEVHLRRAIELEPKAHDARGMLAAVLMKVGQSREAKSLAREVEHRTRCNPLDDWEARLSRRPNKNIRWTQTSEGWVPK